MYVAGPLFRAIIFFFCAHTKFPDEATGEAAGVEVWSGAGPVCYSLGAERGRC